MPSKILEKGYKLELKRDIDDIVSMGVHYWNVKGKYLSRESLTSLLKAYRNADDNMKAFED